MFVVLVLCVFSMNASYSVLLFVLLKFKKREIMHFPLFWMTEIHSVLEPSCVPESSRLIAHISFVHGLFGMLVLLLLPLLLLLLLLEKETIQVSLSLVGRGRSPNSLSDEVEAGHVG